MDQNMFQIILLGVGIGSSFLIGYLFKYPLKPKIEKIFEKNHYNVHVGLMDYVNSFDSDFKMFYDTFEEKFRNIQDLPQGGFLPSVYTPKINETGGITMRPKSESEYTKIQNDLSTFNEFNDNLFKNFEDSMCSEQTRILEYMNKNESYIIPSLRSLISEYISCSIFYVSYFRKGWNYPNILEQRFAHAQEIMYILKSEKIFNNKPSLDKFTKKWQEYDSLK